VRTHATRTLAHARGGGVCAELTVGRNPGVVVRGDIYHNVVDAQADADRMAVKLHEGGLRDATKHSPSTPGSTAPMRVMCAGAAGRGRARASIASLIICVCLTLHERTL
jgi:hypothetical protein